MSDLTDRMRTCAARIISITNPERNDAAINEAPALLVEAADLLDPAKLHPSMPQEERAKVVGERWNMLPDTPAPRAPPGPRDCPGCGDQEPKRADVMNRRIMLTCMRCEKQWPWRPHAEWR